MLRKANQIELVDSSPEQLRRRMVHGNIYPPDKVDRALSHYFRAANLTALREPPSGSSPTRPMSNFWSISGIRARIPSGRPMSASWWG